MKLIDVRNVEVQPFRAIDENLIIVDSSAFFGGSFVFCCEKSIICENIYFSHFNISDFDNGILHESTFDMCFAKI